MYRILRKIKNHFPLNSEEKKKLLLEIEHLNNFPNPAWIYFFNFYSDDLASQGIIVPLFPCDLDTVYSWLLANPDLIEILKHSYIQRKDYPIELADFLSYTFGNYLRAEDFPQLMAYYHENIDADTLPISRSKPPTFKYEEGNPYKEIGLKNHFERIARYSFVSRLQSFRYLNGRLASMDRFEVFSDNMLSGIFTNKEKSIYYYVYLTERNQQRAENACRLLNRVFYDK